MANFLKSLFVKGVEIDPAGATSDQVLKYNGTKFIPGTASTVGSIDDLSDVVINTPLPYQGLMYDGTEWVNSSIPNTFLVRNDSGSTILKGTFVSANGAEGSGRINIVPFETTGTENSELRAIGILTQTLTNGQSGEVMSFGTLRGLDTRGTVSSGLAVGDETWVAGDILYAHPTAVGKLTKVKPQHDFAVAFVTVIGSSNGQIVIRVIPGNNHLEWMHDVDLTTTPTAGQVLTYNGSLWTANTLASGASITISDTPPTSPSAGAFWFESDTGKMFIYYDSVWVEINGGGSGSIQETTITTNSATTITRFDKTTMRSGEFLIQVTQGSKYTVSKVLLIHNGTTPTLAEYGVIELGTTRIPLTISTSISGSDVLVQATVTDAGTTSAYVKVISSLVGL